MESITTDPIMFNQDQIQIALKNAIEGKFSFDCGDAGGWHYSSNKVVYSTGRDYLRVATDGWRSPDQRRIVIKNMRGMAILSLI